METKEKCLIKSSLLSPSLLSSPLLLSLCLTGKNSPRLAFPLLPQISAAAPPAGSGLPLSSIYSGGRASNNPDLVNMAGGIRLRKSISFVVILSPVFSPTLTSKCTALHRTP